jgi:hypothetical protein
MAWRMVSYGRRYGSGIALVWAGCWYERMLACRSVLYGSLCLWVMDAGVGLQGRTGEAYTGLWGISGNRGVCRG